MKSKVTLPIHVSLSIYLSLNVHTQRIQFNGIILLPSPSLSISLQLCSLGVKNKTEKYYLFFYHLTDRFPYDFQTSYLVCCLQTNIITEKNANVNVPGN